MGKLIILVLLVWTGLHAEIKIASSTTDLAAIAKEVGGDLVKAESIARGNQDPHFIEVLPSYMLKVKRADIYLKVGMELDLWAEQIIGGSRNRNLVVVDCSENIKALEVPTGKVDASMGDIHKFGNPHYWLDPLNGIVIAETIMDALIGIDPENAESYRKNLDDFKVRVNQKTDTWSIGYGDLNGLGLLYYHNTWPYFNSRFGTRALGFVEPKPGIMPTPNHVEYLVDLIKAEEIKVLAMEPYFSDTAPKYLLQRTGIEIVIMAPSTGSHPGTNSYLDMIEYNLNALNMALEE